MPIPSTLELIDEALRAESVEDIHTLCSSFARQFGFEYFLFGAHIPISFSKPRILIISGYPREWREHYDRRGYVTIDPTVAHCFKRITPLRWDGIDGADGRLERSVRKFMEEAHEFGLKCGVTFPVHGCQGETALFSLASADSREHSDGKILEALPLAQLLAGYVHEAVLRVLGEETFPLGRVTLTNRERECLLWAAEGKTTWETSQILGIAERTVTFHLQNAASKLNVSNRQQAVARAVSQSLITPQFD